MAAPPAYTIQPLGPRHDRKGFGCGEPSLDEYLQRQASQDVKRDLAVCYVLTEPERATILGYYTLSASSVELHDLPPSLAKQSGRYPLVPAVLQGRLAVALSAHGRGLEAVCAAACAPNRHRRQAGGRGRAERTCCHLLRTSRLPAVSRCRHPSLFAGQRHRWCIT